MATLRAFDGRKLPKYYPDAEVERLIVQDAVQGLDLAPDIGGAVVWWAMEGYAYLARRRRVNGDAVFAEVAAKVTAQTGRVWP